MSPERRRVAVRLLLAVPGVAVVALAVAAVAWRLAGNTWKVVETPSMGAAAPVGTLLWVRRVPRAAIHVGSIITFHPPTEPAATFTHRVVAVLAAGYRTKGDINATPDAWTVPYHDVVGAVAGRWWIGGWVVEALPILLVGSVLLWALTRWCCRSAWRLPVRILGAGLVAALAVHVVRPLLRAALISYRSFGRGARAVVVDTGILPVRVSAPGHHVDVRSGHVASLVVARPGPGGAFELHVGADLPWTWILVGVLVVLAPAIVTAVFGLRPPTDTGA